MRKNLKRERTKDSKVILNRVGKVMKKSIAAAMSASFITVSIMTPVMSVPHVIYASERSGTDKYTDDSVKVYAQSDSVIVTSQSELESALNSGSTNIVISGSVTIAENSDETPFMIPGGVTITGQDDNSGLVFRGAMQLAGDNVTFSGMQLHFISTDALQSAIHREIFLAGHSLILDSVDTYVQGGSGSGLGGFGGTEEELLPTVYAGAYKGSSIGSKASLTINNAIDKTMLKGVYMSHDGDEGKMAYTGDAELLIDAKTTVRKGIHSENNSQADIKIQGTSQSISAGCKVSSFYGNDKTTLTLDKCLCNADFKNIENIILDNEAGLSIISGNLKNITIKNKSFLDITTYGSSNFIEIEGNFTGSASEQTDAYLVTDNTRQLIINGNVTGKTAIAIDNKLFPKDYMSGFTYVTAAGKSSAGSFISLKTGWILKYDIQDNNEASWTAQTGSDEQTKELARINIESAPDSVYLNNIFENDDYTIPDTDAAFYIKCYDANDNIISGEDIEWLTDNVVIIKTEYWEGTDKYNDNTDWGNSIWLRTDLEQYPDKYFIEANESAKAGTYTFLFLPEKYNITEMNDSGELSTVKDVKKLKDDILAEWKIEFTDKEIVQEKMETPSVSVDYYNEMLTGFDTNGTYTVNDRTVTVSQDGTLKLSESYYGTDITIVRKADNSKYTDSDSQIITIPSRREAPQIKGTDADSKGNNNGTITQITSDMEYRCITDGNWTDCTGNTVTGLAPGEYQVRLKADDNNFAGNIASVIIGRQQVKTYHVIIGNGTGSGDYEEGNQVTIQAKQAADGMAFDKWVSDVTLDYIDGTDEFSEKAVFKMPESDVELSAEYKDVTAPSGQITISTKEWTSFCNKVTFGLFFKDTQKVTISAEDKGLGIDRILYYISSEAKSIEDIAALKDNEWTEYTDVFSITPDRKSVVYVKLTDKGGNKKYLSSDGLVFDASSPVISGIKNNESYKDSVDFTVTDDNLEYVEIDGVIAGYENGSYNIANKAGSHVVKAVDKAGNITQITINMLDKEPTTKPTEPTTKPTEPTTKPTEPTTKPTESTTKPTESTTRATESTESTTKATEPTTKPTESTTKATESTTKATEPTESTTKATESTTKVTEATTKPTKPTTKPTEATTKPTEATTKATESTTKATESTTKPTESTTKVTEATTKPTESTTKATESTTKVTEATTKPTKPTTKPTEPTTKPTEPATEAKGQLVLSSDGSWYYMKNGKIDYDYGGLAQNEYGWWKISNGTVDFGYTGLAQNEYGWWKVSNGTVDFSANGLLYDNMSEKWWYFNNGAIDYNYNGLALNEYGWWKISNGTVDFEYTGLALNEYGWWKVSNGTVDFGYTGLAWNEYGWWKIINGTVDFSANGLLYDNMSEKWWYFNNGAVDYKYDGLALNEYGWWKISDGTVDFGYTGLALNEYGWWMVNKGIPDITYNGIAANQYGLWKVSNGTVEFNYTGTYTFGNGTYTIVNGLVQ